MHYLLLVFYLSFPSLVSAHTRWFAEDNLTPHANPESPLPYLLIFSVIVVAVLVVGSWLERQDWLDFEFLKPRSPHIFERAASTFVMVSGAFFLIAGTHQYLFSPNLTPAAGVPLFIISIQIIVGLALLLGLASRIAGLILIGLWVSVFHYAGSVAALEDIWVLSTALFITLMGNQYFALTSFSFLRNLVAPYRRYALSILRLGTGLTLLILGFSEKILAPELGLNFLEHYHWNFMATLGLPYSDYLFTLSAGAVEALFGLVFIMGIMTRLNALVVAIVFTLPLFILGPIELAGHLPHFAAIILLLLFGNGGYFLPFAMSKRKH